MEMPSAILPRLSSEMVTEVKGMLPSLEMFSVRVARSLERMEFRSDLRVRASLGLLGVRVRGSRLSWYTLALPPETV